MTVEYLVADLLTGTVRDEVPFSSFGYDDVLNRPGGWTATLPIRHPKARRSLLEPGAVAVWVVDGDSVLNAGILWELGATIDENGGELVSLGGQGLLSAYREGRRTIRSRLGMTHAFGPLPSDVRWDDATDPFEVVEDLFGHTAAIAGAADLGIPIVRRGPGVSGYTGTTIDGTIELTTDERRSIYELLEELADVDGGIDFGLVYRWAGNNLLAADLELYWPSRGRVTGHVFEAGKNITILDWQVSASELANFVNGIGAGEGDSMLRVGALDGTNLYPAGLGYPLLESSVDAKQVTDSTILTDLAVGELKRTKTPRNTLKVELIDTEDVPLGSFVPGDFITVAATEGIYELDGLWRVAALHPDFDEDGKVTVTVDLAGVEHYEDLV
jgi:hypothetical protein